VKKYLAIILGAVFVLGFAASAFAIHAEIPAETQAVVAKGQTEITIGGEVRVRGEIRQNVSDFDDDKQDRQLFYNSRVRLSVEAKVTPNTMGMIQIEAGDADDANGRSVNNFIGGNAAPNQGQGVYKEGEHKKGTLNLIQAWLQHTGSGLLGVPAGIKVGHMPLALGNKLFFDHSLFGDDAIVLFADPTKELHLGLLTVKFREGTTTLNDDSTAYVGLFNYRTKEFGLSGDVAYVDDQNKFSTLPLPAGADAHLWNFALRGDVKVAGLGLYADVDVQAGKVQDVGPTDVKFRGYAFMGGVNYTLAPVKLYAEYAYGSGDKAGTADKFELFVTSLTQIQYGTYVYDFVSAGASGVTFAGIANTQRVKVGAAADLAKNLSGNLDFYWLRANKVAAGVSKSIGTEIDAKITYKVDRNLSYWIEGGYLFAGNFYKSRTGGKDPDDAYAWRHGIMLSF
jgi:hypothetical protein